MADRFLNTCPTLALKFPVTSSPESGSIAILSSWTAITERVKEYYVFLLLLQTGMIGAFVALDALLFFLFWEVMLVPMYFLIGIWGSDRDCIARLSFSCTPLWVAL